MTHSSCRGRRGAVMIVVMGLITILLSLVLGVTVKVYNGIKNGSNVTQNAQAWIMMEAARMSLARQRVAATPLPWATANSAVTIGNILAADIPDKRLDDRLGWAHIRQVGTATQYYVFANGGGSAGPDTSSPPNVFKETTLTDGDPVRNAMDVRYLYFMEYKEPPVVVVAGWNIKILKAATEAYVAANYW